MHFLDTIGNVARHSVRWLRLTVSGDTKMHIPTVDQALIFWDIISECKNIETLDIYAKIDYFYMDQQTALKSCMYTEGYPVSHPWFEVLNTIQALLNLKRLILRRVFSLRWRYSDVAGDGTLTTPDVTVYEARKVPCEIYRPIDEATRLTE
jgi:hypothetical protein